MRLGKYEAYQTDFFRSLMSILRYRLNLHCSDRVPTSLSPVHVPANSSSFRYTK